MAENKKSFILYSDARAVFEQLTHEEAGVLIKHIFRYVNDENPILEDRYINLAFQPIKLQLKRDLVKWDAIKEKRSLAGKASAESKKQTSTNSTSVESVEQTSTNSTVSDNVIVIVNDTVINNNINVRFESYKKECLISEQWKETFYIKNQLTPVNFESALIEYNLHLIQQSETKNSLNDYKKHFANWITKRKEIKSSQEKIKKNPLL